MIPSASHPWSPWRPLSAIGWAGFAACLLALFAATCEYGTWASHKADACRIRWGSAKTVADSVRVAGDCGVRR